jgi:hypothetical protein
LFVIYSLITGSIVKCDRPFCFTVSTNDRRPKDCMTFKSSGGDSCRFSGIFEMSAGSGVLASHAIACCSDAVRRSKCWCRSDSKSPKNRVS